MDNGFSEVDIRVRYEETDKMGVVYYANYFVWFEIARTEFFRERGVSYRELEEKRGIKFMVVDAYCRYKKSAHYDDLIAVKTSADIVRATSVRFNYEVKREDDILAVGNTFHVFVVGDKACRIPQDIADKVFL